MNDNASLKMQGSRHRVHSVRALAGGTYVLRFNRQGREFEPGQYLSLGIRGEIDMREYSIYSSLKDDCFEALIKEIDTGLVSRRLRRVHPGDALAVDGPFGFFTIDAEQRATGRFLFIATGTGIAPFRCFALSYPQLDYRIVHGVRHCDECYDKDAYGKDRNGKDRYLSCVSREGGGDFNGRVTDWLRHNQIAPDTLCYLCGNCDMIYEAFDILTAQGVASDQLFAEVYF